MGDGIVTLIFALSLLRASALGANSAAPRDDLDAGSKATLLRREMSVAESFEVPYVRAITPATPKTRTGKFRSEHVSHISKRSFAEEALMSRLSSTLWLNSQPAPPSWSKTQAASVDDIASGSHGGWVNGDGSDKFIIHKCGNDDTMCAFTGCASDGSIASCHNDNCFTSKVSDTATCAGAYDGKNVPPDEFCVNGYPTKICPPSECKDISEALDGTSCSALISSDPSFCRNTSLQSMIEVFCRNTCGLCTTTKATCGDADGNGPLTSAVICPPGYFGRAGVDSVECDNTPCDTTSNGLTGDTSKCCQPYTCSAGDGPEDCKSCMPQNQRTTQNHCSDCNVGSGNSSTNCTGMKNTTKIDKQQKRNPEIFSARRVGLATGLAGILMLLCCLCTKSSASVQQKSVEIPVIDEVLLKEASYLKRSDQFPKPLQSKVAGGYVFWGVFFLVLTLLIGSLSVRVARQALPCYYCTHPGAIFATIILSLELVWCSYGIYRWNMYFKELPIRLDKNCVVNPGLQTNTLEPTPMSMRPQYMSCLGFLWCMHAIYIAFAPLAVLRIIKSQFYVGKVSKGVYPPSKSVEAAFGVFMLETTAFLWFKGMKEETDGKLIGHFSSMHLGPIRTPLKETGVHDIGNVEIWVDLKERTAVRATIDNVEIKLSRGFCLVLYMMIGAGHAWLHAICQFAILPESHDPFIRRMSLCTMFFNHLGFDGGLPILAFLAQRWEYITAGNKRSVLFGDILPYNDEDYMLGPYMAAVQTFFTPELAGNLVPYSRFCAWSYFLYSPFMALLEAEPTTITLSPLSYFYHTVLHCTDHWSLIQMFNQSSNDWANLVLPCEDAQSGEYGKEEPHFDYGAMEVVPVISTGGLSEDFPKPYNVYFRDGPEHIGFFKKVFEIANFLDPELAYHLQACIIK